jgi:predicted dehydrogenase
MARSSRECDEIIHEVSKNKVKLCICHNQLFLPSVMKAKAIVDSSNFPLAYFKVLVRESAELIGAPKWIMTPEQGGVLWETGAHATYLQLHFLREVEKVWAIGEKIQNSLYDHFIIMLTNPSQTIGVIEISWLAQKEEEKFEFIDTKGRKIEIINYNFFLEDSGKEEKNLLEGFFKDQKRIIKKWQNFSLTTSATVNLKAASLSIFCLQNFSNRLEMTRIHQYR